MLALAPQLDVGAERVDGRQRRERRLSGSDRSAAAGAGRGAVPSLEPLLGPMPRLLLRGIHWVIVGGESGPGARRWNPSGSADPRPVRARVPFFFKQWGGVQKSRNGRELDGRTWDEMPVELSKPEPVVDIQSRRLALVG